jgi:hypothetical protein
MQRVCLQEKHEKALEEIQRKHDADSQRETRKLSDMKEEMASCRADTAAAFKSLEKTKLQVEHLQEQLSTAQEDLKHSKAAQSRLLVLHFQFISVLV